MIKKLVICCARGEGKLLAHQTAASALSAISALGSAKKSLSGHSVTVSRELRLLALAWESSVSMS